MQNITWGEGIFGGILGVIALIGPSALLYVLLSAVFDIESIYGISVFSLAVMAVGLAGSVLIASIYPGTDRLLQHAWILALVFIALPVIFISLVWAGTVSSDTAIGFVVGVCAQLSSYLFVLLFVLYIHARGVSVSLSRAEESTAEWRTRLFMRR